jgi:hypothetical protein
MDAGDYSELLYTILGKANIPIDLAMEKIDEAIGAGEDMKEICVVHTDTLIHFECLPIQEN